MLHGSNHFLRGANHFLHSANHFLHGSNHFLHGANHFLHGANHLLHSANRLRHGANAYFSIQKPIEIENLNLGMVRFAAMNEVILLLGSNLGDREAYLNKAAILIEGSIGNIFRKSSIYETAAFGNENQGAFLNQIITVLVDNTPHDLLEITMNIEAQLGRHRTAKWADRTIDIDILFIGNTIINDPDLIIPHPEIAFRRFTLIPLNELIPDFLHPKMNKTIHILMEECTDKLPVTKVLTNEKVAETSPPKSGNNENSVTLFGGFKYKGD